MDELIAYLERQSIVIDRVSDDFIQISGQTYELVRPQNGKLFDDHFQLIIDEPTPCDHYIFSFGGVWYHTPRGSETVPQLNRVQYLGHRNSLLPTEIFLGVRAGYELLNGVGLYETWVQKARFLGVRALGICEKNTLAGTLKFQNVCIKYGIRPILGATYTVYRKEEDFKYDIKCYIKDENGWTNLLLMNTEVNVKNARFIDEKRFFELTDGLFVVLDPKSIEWSRLPFYELGGCRVYYQLDPAIYVKEDRDKSYLQNLKRFVSSELQPIAITDAFYANKEDFYLKTTLNRISNTFEHESEYQYLKSKDEYFDELDVLFADPSRSLDFFQRAIVNEHLLAESCTFQVPQGRKHLPLYMMTQEESAQFDSNEDLFWALIAQGMSQKVPQEKQQQYLERIQEEIEVIETGGFIDYFLILWDIIKWSNSNGILSGVGRGSAGGSLVAYLLNITRLDPIEFGLLFSRFLNRGRLGQIQNYEVFVINDDIELDFEKKVNIFRASNRITISVKDLQYGDQLIDF